MFISLGIICQTVTVFGTVSNVINCIIFVKQGFSDTINISLLSLALSDLCSLLCIMWSNLCFTPAFQDSGIPMATYEVHLITGSWPHVIFTRTTGWITAFISLERCVCVIRPLKVKTIFTRRRHILAMISFFVIPLSCGSLAYLCAGLEWRFSPERNRTLIGLVYHMDAYRRRITHSVSYAVNGVLMPVSCFVSVVVLTTVLVTKLNKKSAWRHFNSSSVCQKADSSNNKVNIKDMKAAKMVVLISIIFITSFIPAVAIFIAGFVDPQLSYDGLYKNLFLVTLSVSFTTEAFNSSINICVYFVMSTKYRRSFLRMFTFYTSGNAP
ncbi:unnamed protein product [Candidula unifasciata]|uniref:G-protein coupled receptors family 1 profile domain-containing protein n=1 Tax=Candidula unifasciata TaxID=100452 RepID=A0A8S3ZVA0_9EUPU|nr:unnamed protein product [Candidula unifasciata]